MNEDGFMDSPVVVMDLGKDEPIPEVKEKAVPLTHSTRAEFNSNYDTNKLMNHEETKKIIGILKQSRTPKNEMAESQNDNLASSSKLNQPSFSNSIPTEK